MTSITIRRSLLAGFILLFSLLVWVVPARAAGEVLLRDFSNPDISILQSEGDEIHGLRGAHLSIPVAEVTTPTTLTVEIVGSPWVVVDSNGQPGVPDGDTPSVYVIAAEVTNTGSATATDVIVTLAYNPSGNWVLLSGEDPVRMVDELGSGETYNAYWLARYPETVDATHQYTVSAVADNADLVSTSENKHAPSSSPTVETRSTIGSGNQALTQTSADVTVGVAFTMTQVFDLGTNPKEVAFNPVGNDDFKVSAYRLLAVEGRIFDDVGAPLDTFTDAVYLSLSQSSLPASAAGAEVTYTFLALLPEDTSLCSYAGIGFLSGGKLTEKYDQNFCSNDENTIFILNGGISLELNKQVNLVNVEQNQVLDYTITYTNTGDADIRFGWIWDDVPANVSIITTSISPASDAGETTDSRVAWNLGTIAATGQTGSSGTLSFSVLVDGNGQDIADGVELTNEAKFGISPSGLPNNEALTSTVVSTVQAPTITMSKTDGQDTANPGDSLTYIVQITNSGSIPASGLVVTDVLPVNVSLNGATTPAFDSQNGQTLIWNSLSPIAGSGGTLNITIPVLVDPELSQDGTLLTNSSTVRYQNSAGHTFTPQTATDNTTVEVPETQLSLSKTAVDLNGEPLLVGDSIRYTLQVTNTGTFTAYNVTVTDDLPDEVECQSVSGGLTCADPLVWDVGNLGAGATATLYIVVKILPAGEGQSIVNSGSVTATNVVDPVPEPETCPDGSEPDPVDGCENTPGPATELSLSKTATDLNGEPLVVGDLISYTLRITNTGTFTAYNVIVTDDLPDEVACQSVSGAAELPCADLITWNVGDLGPGATTEPPLYIVVKILPIGEGKSIVNSFSVITNVVDPEEPEVCPDGSEPDPVDGCEITPGPPDVPNVFLPIILKMN